MIGRWPGTTADVAPFPLVACSWDFVSTTPDVSRVQAFPGGRCSTGAGRHSPLFRAGAVSGLRVTLSLHSSALCTQRVYESAPDRVNCSRSGGDGIPFSRH